MVIEDWEVVDFVYRPWSVSVGAALSLASVDACMAAVWSRGRPKASCAQAEASS